MFNQPLIAKSQSEDNLCKVEITGGPLDSNLRMYPGQKAQFTATLTNNLIGNIIYTWTVDGPIIKAYDDRADDPYPSLVSETHDIKNPTPMSPDDFHKQSIEFFWQPNATDTNRTVAVQVQTPHGQCTAARSFVVEKNNSDTNLQAEDFYLGHILPFGANENLSSIPLREHMLWHEKHMQNNRNYSGSTFIDFHRAYIAHFDAFRTLFGYPNITQWNPSDSNLTKSKAVDVDHLYRLVRGDPYSHSPLPTYFKVYENGTGPEARPITKYNDSGVIRDRPCEVIHRPTDPSKIPQDALNDFDVNLELLGCGLTVQYHNSIHRTAGQLTTITEEDAQRCPDCLIIPLENGTLIYLGDMMSTTSAPRDPLFWKLHKFIDNIALNRTKLEKTISSSGSSSLALNSQEDITPPRVSYKIPYILDQNKPGLPTLSEESKDLFNMTDVQYISVEFSEPVLGIKAKDLNVNGSFATRVNGTGAGPYVFIGFEPPKYGPLNVTLSAGNITDASGNRFEGTSWSYNLFNARDDKDGDGIQDGIKVKLLLGDPTQLDTDGDTIPDGFEAASTTCLDPLVNDAVIMDITGDIISKEGIDSDRDGVSNVDEYRQGTDPCVKPSQTRGGSQFDDSFVLGGAPRSTPQIEETTPFLLSLKTTGGISAENNKLSYNSLTKEAISVLNNNETRRHISDSDENIAIRTLNNSGFFNTTSFYPPPPNNTDYFEFTMFAILGNKLHAIYWTDVSEGVPDSIKNLPYAMTNILGTGVEFKEK